MNAPRTRLMTIFVQDHWCKAWRVMCWRAQLHPEQLQQRLDIIDRQSWTALCEPPPAALCVYQHSRSMAILTLGRERPGRIKSKDSSFVVRAALSSANGNTPDGPGSQKYEGLQSWQKAGINISIFPQLSPNATPLCGFRGNAFKYFGWAFTLRLSSVTHLSPEGPGRRGKPEERSHSVTQSDLIMGANLKHEPNQHSCRL